MVKPLPKRSPPKPQSWLWLIVVGLVLVMGFKKFSDAFFKKDGEWIMKKSYQEHVKDKRDKFSDCEVYYLVALQSGFYKCELCERGTFYLKQGEIYKIGLTCNGKDRYKSAFYRQMRVEFVTVFEGDLSSCSAREIAELGNYPLRAQNRQRPDPSPETKAKGRYKLLLPPANSGLK